MWDRSWRFHPIYNTRACISHSSFNKRFGVEFWTVISLIHQFSASVERLHRTMIDSRQRSEFIHKWMMPVKNPHTRVIIHHFVKIIQLSLMRSFYVEIYILSAIVLRWFILLLHSSCRRRWALLMMMRGQLIMRSLQVCMRRRLA